MNTCVHNSATNLNPELSSIVPPQNDRLLKINEACYKAGLSRAAIYEKAKAGLFPKQVSLFGAKCARWSEREIDEWIQARLDERDAA